MKEDTYYIILKKAAIILSKKPIESNYRDDTKMLSLKFRLTKDECHRILRDLRKNPL